MRSSVIACFLHSASAAATNEDGTSLMQRRFIKQMGNNVLDSKKLTKELPPGTGEVWEDGKDDLYDVSPPEPPHVCGVWDAWSTCTASCGGGLQSRTYTFLDGVICGKSCPHGDGDLQQRECNTDVACPVDCEGGWGEYGACSVSCGGGLQARMFQVTQEALHGGVACAKANGAMEDHACSTQQCEVNCKGHWDDWDECSNDGAGPQGQDCGPGGTHSRGYTISTQQTEGGCGCMATMWGADAEGEVDGSTTDTRSCELPCCPEPCEGSYGRFGECTGPKVQSLATIMPAPYGYGYVAPVTDMCCGGGTKTKTFSVSKDLVCGGKKCAAPDGHVVTETCCEAPCPVPCEGHWGDPSECCSSCGGGQTEAIYIITQEALHGGEECPHEAGDIKHEGCNEDVPCPIDCEGYWNEWDGCTDWCGPDGTQTRHWIVTVEAEFGGQQCSHIDKVQTRSCDPEPIPCPVPAVCGWTEYGDCTADCFDTVTQTTITKTREWIELSPAQHGGKECIDDPPADESPTAVCAKANCPIPCIGGWGPFDECNAEVANECGGGHFCGRGTRTKIYHVSQPALYGGEQCPWEDGHKKAKVCGDVPCPIDCEGSFDEWGHCSTTCGGGSQSRDFVINVEAQYGGCECSHAAHTEHRACGEDPCPINCEGKWNEWGECNQKCTDCRNDGAVGISQSTFQITVAAQYGGLECVHTDGEIKEKSCNENCCAEDCEGYWTEFGDCSTSCGNGVTERTFHVTHHEAHGGVPCPYCDLASHTKACEDRPLCGTDCKGYFYPWSECSEKCGGGNSYAYFYQEVMAENGGKDCDHGQFEMVVKNCNEQACPVNCIGGFGPPGPCDAECSGGERHRTFMHFIAAQNGGHECSHAAGDVDALPCNMHDCPDGYVCPPVKECKYANGLIQRR